MGAKISGERAVKQEHFTMRSPLELLITGAVQLLPVQELLSTNL
jgi:hypothetical protein